MEKQNAAKWITQVKLAVNFHAASAARIDKQLKVCLDKVDALAEDEIQNSATLENTQKRIVDVSRSSNQTRELLEDSESKVERTRATLLEMERFDKRRVKNDLEVARRKMSSSQAQAAEELSVIEKLQQELREYKDIVKCSICHDRPKEVAITKCYHLFCNSCVQKIIEICPLKCPVCGLSFGNNDLKPVYI